MNPKQHKYKDTHWRITVKLLETIIRKSYESSQTWGKWYITHGKSILCNLVLTFLRSSVEENGWNGKGLIIFRNCNNPAPVGKKWLRRWKASWRKLREASGSSSTEHQGPWWRRVWQFLDHCGGWGKPTGVVYTPTWLAWGLELCILIGSQKSTSSGSYNEDSMQP